MSELTWDDVKEIAVPFIGREEGFRAEPYLDSVGIPTIGYGTIKYPDGRRVTLMDSKISESVALKLLEDHVQDEVWNQVLEVCPPLTVNQCAAIVSFVYNLGFGAFSKSTLLKKLKAGDIQGAADEFPKWNRAGGKVLKGLTARRNRERTLFLS